VVLLTQVVDRDGTLDLLLAENGPSDQILIGHNRQMPLCVHPWDTGCHHPTQLCTPDPNYLNTISFAPGAIADVSIINLGSANLPCISPHW